MKRLFIEPLNVLMFRSERPFTAIESHVAKLGVISPLTFEGSIKSKIFTEFCNRKDYSPSDFQRNKRTEENVDEFKNRIRRKVESDKELREILKLIGHPAVDFKSRLNVIGAFFSKKEETLEYFPVPKDIVREDKKNGRIVKVKPSQKIKLLENNLSAVLPQGYSKIEEVDGLINCNELKRYLCGGTPQVNKFNNEGKKPYLKEMRSGIKLERETKNTEEGALYTAEFLRVLDEWGFVVWYESIQNISKGLVRLGGEGKGAICKNIKGEININEKLNSPQLIKRINRDKVFKLYLATPSYLSGCIPPTKKLERILQVNLKQIAAIPGKPVYIGGYDFAMNKEKPLQRWVDAGAVYYYKFDGEINTDLNIPIKIIENDGIDMRCAFIGIGGNKNV